MYRSVISAQAKVGFSWLCDAFSNPRQLRLASILTLTTTTKPHTTAIIKN
jgi:hypothetical protein